MNRRPASRYRPTMRDRLVADISRLPPYLAGTVQSNWMRLALLLLSVAFAGSAAATVAISATIVIEPDPGTLLRGQTATLTYTVTNVGDEPLQGAFASTGYINFGPQTTIFPVATPATAPCLNGDFAEPLPPPLPSSFLNTTTFRPVPILPGEIRVCVIEITLSADAAGPFVQPFLFSTQPATTNPAPLRRNVYFGLGEDQPVPTLSMAGGGLLLCCLGILAWWTRFGSAPVPRRL